MPVAIIGAAVLGAGATMYSANANRQAAGHAANVNAQTIKDTQETNTSLFEPYTERGNKAGDAINDFLGLNGTQGQNEAFDNYKNSTGYQFQLKSGSDAINTNRAASGLLKSGATLKSLEKYGQNVANTYSQNYLSNLQGQQSAGLSAAGGNAASNSNAAGMSVNNQNALASQTIGANTDASNAFQNLLGNAVSAYGYGKGQSSYGSADGGAKQPSAAMSPWKTSGIYL